jgi:hypothetical protein
MARSAALAKVTWTNVTHAPAGDLRRDAMEAIRCMTTSK